MKNKIKLILMIGLSFNISFSSYYNVIKKNNNYEIVASLKTEVTNWISISDSYCEYDLNQSDFYYGVEFNQNIICKELQERDVVQYRMDNFDNKIIVSTTKENRENILSQENSLVMGIHLEKSCNDIITKGYNSNDGVYKVGEASDNFDVYCDMRGNEGWTLLGKINTSNRDSINEPNNWFISESNLADVLTPNDIVNNGMSSLGITKINKLNISNVAEFKLMSQQMDQEVNFYKEANKTNMANWFNTNETTTTKVCLDSNLSQSCKTSRFIQTDAYELNGMNLSDKGYQNSGVLHLRMNSNDASFHSGVCSYTLNNNGNQWHDTYNQHWGNGMLIYAK